MIFYHSNCWLYKWSYTAITSTYRCYIPTSVDTGEFRRVPGYPKSHIALPAHAFSGRLRLRYRGCFVPNRWRHLATDIVRQQVLQRHPISLVNDTVGGIRNLPLLSTDGHSSPRPGVHYTHRSPQSHVYKQQSQFHGHPLVNSDQELDFKIHFVPGSQNKWADTLSRLCPNLMELAMDYTLWSGEMQKGVEEW